MVMKNTEALGVTITILNKLSAADNATKLDAWYKSTISMAQWQISTQSAQNGTQTNVGAVIKVDIPKQKNYLPYKWWKATPDGNITFNQGDYIVKGEVSEDITASNIVSVLNKYGQDVCRVRNFKDNTNSGLSFAPVGLLKYAECYTIEGE